MNDSDNKNHLMTQVTDATSFVKSSFSGNGSGSDCLEVAKLDGGVCLRDSKNPGMMIFLTNTEYSAFTQGVQAGETGLTL